MTASTVNDVYVGGDIVESLILKSSPALKNLLNNVSVPLIVLETVEIATVPIADEIPAIDGTVNVKSPTDVVPIPIGAPLGPSVTCM